MEDLAGLDGVLHPVQDAMLRHHGSQCGFCTPGIVMSLFTLYHAGGRSDRQAVNDTLAGNLCRCTGYRPIVDAALEACDGPPRDAFASHRAATAERLAALDDGEDLFIGDEASSFLAAPATVDALARLYARHPDATLVAGATDVGLWITKQLRALAEGHSIGACCGPRGHPRERAGLPFRRRRHPCARRERHGGDRPRPRRDVPPFRRQAGARGGDDRRQYRQRLPHRRFDARPDRARPRPCTCAGARRRGRCRWRTSSSTTASRTGRRASSSPGSTCRACSPMRSSAATRSPSASTRTFPACWAPSGSPWRGAASAKRASPTAAWPPRRSGPSPRKPPSKGPAA